MTKRYKNLLFYWFPVLIYCLLIYIQSSYPSAKNIPAVPNIDKLLHLAAYAILGALFFRAFRVQRFKENINLVIMLSILSSSFYGITDEIHQYYVPSRNADIMDIIADILGSICGVCIYYLFAITLKKRGRSIY